MLHTFHRLRGALAVAGAALLLTACAQPWQNYQTGADASAITTRLGPPREVYDLPNGGKRLMWPTQPLGEFTTAADIDASGKIVSVRQVLTKTSSTRRRSAPGRGPTYS